MLYFKPIIEKCEFIANKDNENLQNDSNKYYSSQNFNILKRAIFIRTSITSITSIA